MAIPYAPSRSYIPDSTIIQLIQQAGQDAAEGQRRGGQIWGNAIGNVGQIAAGTIRDISEGRARAADMARRDAIEAPKIADESRLRALNIQKAERERSDSEQEAMKAEKLGAMFSGQEAPSPNAIIGLMGPQRGFAIVQGMTALLPDSEKRVARYRDQMNLFRDAIGGLAATPGPLKPQAWQMARAGLISKGLISEDTVPAEWSPEAEATAINFGRAPEKHQGFSLGANETRFDENGKPIAHGITPPKGPDNTRGDRVYQQERVVIDKLSAPIEERAARSERLLAAVDAKTPAADALVGPEFLTVMAGGMGSGLRMNEAELNRIFKGRSNWENLRAAVMKWNPNSGDALSITDTQRGQIRQLIEEVNQKAQARVDLIDSARNKLIDAPDPDSARRITADLRSALSGLGKSAPAPGSPSAPKTVVPRKPGESLIDYLKRTSG